MAINVKKFDHAAEGGALVAVDERVVLRYAKAEPQRKLENIVLAIVAVQLPRRYESGVQQVRVTDARRASERLQPALVKLNYVVWLEPENLTWQDR